MQAKKFPVSERNSQSSVDLSQWLERQANRSLLRFITCGSVDEGKSTLIGRLLWESSQILDDQMTALQADSKQYGTQGSDIDFALLVDGLVAEREQGITIDVAYRFFSTARRKFIVADTPGHEQYTRNMVSGASTADLAVLLVDARRGVQTQTKRHAYLAALVGIRHIALVVNKMDLVEYSSERFEEIRHDFASHARSLGFDDLTAIPLSALKGDNMTTRSAQMSWYNGPTLMGYLETVPILHAVDVKVAFPVQWISRGKDGIRGLCGTVASGEIKVGDALRITASGQVAKVARLVSMGGNLTRVEAGDAVNIVLDREVDASRGDILSLGEQPLEMTDQFEATIVWMHEDPGLIGRTYDIKLANQWSGASVTAIKYRLDVNSMTHESCHQLALNDIAVCNLALGKRLVFDSYAQSHTLGGFILVDKFTNATVGAGMIRHNLRRAQNVHRQILSVTREDRERLNGHRGMVIWFTGLSGAGKSTLANALETALHAQGRRSYILDGDNIRLGLNRDLGFTDADRVENIRRVTEVAKLMMDAGLIVMTAFISPFEREREIARQLIGAGRFVEVFVNTPLEICEERDPKGLYKKARAGLLPNMTGIGSVYEQPSNPEITLLPSEDINQNIARILDFISDISEQSSDQSE